MKKAKNDTSSKGGVNTTAQNTNQHKLLAMGKPLMKKATGPGVMKSGSKSNNY